MGLNQVRQSHIYQAIRSCREEFGYSVEKSCKFFGVSRTAYYRWLSGKKCRRELENKKIAEIVEQIHTENPDKGYRRIKDDLTHDYKLNVNEKRVLRICRSLDIKSTIKYKNNGCTRQAAKAQARSHGDIPAKNGEIPSSCNESFCVFILPTGDGQASRFPQRVCADAEYFPPQMVLPPWQRQSNHPTRRL